MMRPIQTVLKKAVSITPSRFWLAAAIVVGISGCAHVADTRLARQDLFDSPDRYQSAALRDLHFLADKGYADAKIVIAEHYARIGKPQNIDETDLLFQQMVHVNYLYNKRYSNWLFNVAKVTPNFREKALKNLWARMETQGDMGPQILRLEAIYADDINAVVERLFTLIDQQAGSRDVDKIRIVAELDDVAVWLPIIDPICQTAVDAEFYCLRTYIRHAKKYDSSRLSTLTERVNQHFVSGVFDTAEVISLMKLLATNNPDLGTGSIQLAYAAAKSAINTSPDVFLAYAGYEIGQPVFFENDVFIEKLSALREQYPLANVLLGRIFMEGRRSVEYPERALGYLEQGLPDALASYYLAQLLLSGKMGEAHLQIGVDHLVVAARGGEYRAYRQLFQLFTSGEGIKPNPLYAHTFANVFQRLGYELSEFDNTQLSSVGLSPSQQAQVGQMVERELNAIVPVSDVE